MRSHRPSSTSFVSALVFGLGAVAACGSSSSGPASPLGDGGLPETDGSGAGTSASTLGLNDETVALDGAQLPKLLGAAPATLAAFRWDGSSWTAVRMQTDPRQVRPFADALSPGDPRKPLATGVTTSFYTDSNAAPGDGTTYVGADTDPTFDRDDELVLALADLGGRAPTGAAPTGVDASSRTEIAASEQSDATRIGYVYVFAGATAPASFPPLVTMNVAFPSSAGDFKSFYATNASSSAGTSRGCGAAGWGVEYPEDTTVTGASYERHFAGRWLSDEMRVIGASGKGPDVIDAYETRPVFASLDGEVGATTANPLPDASHACARSTTSFSGGPGTIVTLRNGPLRAIRSYFGANSGTITERTHLFYPHKEDVYTYLRVHPIAGAADGLDLSPDAIGMIYFDEHNLTGFAVDGKPDTYDRTFAKWEMITGASQGTFLSVHRQLLVDLGPGSTTTYAPQMMWLDVGKTTCICTGDDELLGVNGPAIRDPAGPLPNTDPLRGPAGQVFLLRSLYYSEGVTTPAEAAARTADTESLVVSVDGRAPFDPYAVTCGDGVCEANETSANCAADCPPVAGASTCGDKKCVAGEEFVCLGDCPPTAHSAYFSCLSTSCPTTYDACGADPGCIDGLDCLQSCTAAYADCQQTCAATISDPGSLDLAKALASCGTPACASTF